MNDAELQDIEATLRRVRFVARPTRDEQILSEAAMSSLPVMRSGWRKFVGRAAAAMVPVMLGVALFTYLRHPTLTLAQVTQAVAKQSWVHVKYDNGREEWNEVATGRVFFKDHDGRCVYTQPDGLRYTFWPHMSTAIFKDKWFVGDEPPPRDKASTPWKSFVEPYLAASNNSSGSIERHDENVGGQALIRFDCFLTDALQRRLLVRQIWADPKTRLPVKTREVLTLAEREGQKRDSINGDYDFPATGPSTLADLGVPTGLVVIDEEAKPADDMATFLAAAKMARERFPSTYRLMVWTPNDENGSLDVIYRDGSRSSWTRWFLTHQAGVPDFPLGGSLAEVEKWVGTRTPVQIMIDDGKREFSRSNNVFNEPNRPAARTRVTPTSNFPDDPNVPPGTFWPYVNRAGTPAFVPPPAGSPPGVVLLRSEFGDRRSEYLIDPAHDYLCLRAASQKRVDGVWKDERADALSDFHQLSTGQWYARIRKTEQHPMMPGISDSTYEETIDLQVMESAKMQAGVFDGEPLLKGAKVETY